MNTPAHALIAAALFAKPGQPKRTAAAVLGGLLPDLSLYFMVAWERFANQRTPQQIFDEDYFDPFWRTVFAIDNSAPLYAVLIGIGLWLKLPWLWALAAAALCHVALDFPLHHDDGRPHLWPFSDWIFESPVSYWDVRHYGGVVGPIETALALVVAIILWRRFPSVLARTAIAAAAIAQLSTGAIWLTVFG